MDFAATNSWNSRYIKHLAISLSLRMPTNFSDEANKDEIWKMKRESVRWDVEGVVDVMNRR
jgi:hypothetical protein